MLSPRLFICSLCVQAVLGDEQVLHPQTGKIADGNTIFRAGARGLAELADFNAPGAHFRTVLQLAEPGALSARIDQEKRSRLQYGWMQFLFSGGIRTDG